MFEHVTRPRISTVVTGKRPDGSTYSDGLAANVEFFDLVYLDPGMVRRGREFAAIAPLLWLEAGAAGERIDRDPDDGWALTAPYGVLFTIDALTPFAVAVAEAAKDSQAPRRRLRRHRLPDGVPAAAERLPVGHRDRAALRGLPLQLHHQHRRAAPVKFTLEDYQADRRRGRPGRHRARPAADYAEDGERTAIGLTAPTGAGKTVIATAVLEGLYFGTPTRERTRT